jgi:endonuclease/exonuclease/phosphatase family metal-dependent hydrolase
MSMKESPCSPASPSPRQITGYVPLVGQLLGDRLGSVSVAETSSPQVLSRDMNDSGDREHQRVCLRARILPPGCRALDFLVTHLTLSDPARFASPFVLLSRPYIPAAMSPSSLSF